MPAGLGAVCAHVRLESVTLCSSVPTARCITGVRPLPCVCAQMNHEITSHCRSCSHSPEPRTRDS